MLNKALKFCKTENIVIDHVSMSIKVGAGLGRSNKQRLLQKHARLFEALMIRTYSFHHSYY